MNRWFTLPVLAIAAALAAPSLSRAQSANKAYTPPKTPWGDPDLQGLWPATEMINTPLQRPETFGERSVLTDEEYRQRESRANQVAAADAEEFRAPDAARSIGPPGYWLEHGKPNRQASLIVDPPNGRMPALTPEAQQKNDARAAARKLRGPADSWEDRSYYDRCISRGVMGSILPVIYNNGNQILQARGLVIIRYEMIHETRIIPLDGRAHAGPAIRSYMGDPRGHWEGSTLVVETTNLLGDRNGIGLNGNGMPHSDALRLTERFTRVDANTINYEAIIDDPKTWVRPWKIAFPLKRDDGFQVYEYACHEGNYALRDILAGARADEKKAAAEAAAKAQ